MTRLRLSILISGRGSNMLSLLDACSAPGFAAEPVLVLSNRPDAQGLITASDRGIRAIAVDHKPFGKNRAAFEAELTACLEAAETEIIALAGFMRILTPEFTERWQGRMINIHPSLLPQYKGAHAIQDAFEASENVTGCTVHHVIPEMDAGEIILQEEVPILPDDTFDTLAKRIHAAEHRIYPNALAQLVASKVTSA